MDRCVSWWDTRLKDAPIRVARDAHRHEATCVAVTGSGQLVASGGADCAVRLWDAGSGAPRGVLSGHTGAVRRLAFSPDDSQLASAGADSSLILWRLE